MAYSWYDVISTVVICCAVNLVFPLMRIVCDNLILAKNESEGKFEDNPEDETDDREDKPDEQEDKPDEPDDQSNEQEENDRKKEIDDKSIIIPRLTTARTRTRRSTKRPPSQNREPRADIMIRYFCNDQPIFDSHISLSCYLLFGVNSGIGRLIGNLGNTNANIANMDVLNIMYKDAPGQLFITGTVKLAVKLAVNNGPDDSKVGKEDKHMITDAITRELVGKIGLQPKQDSLHLLHTDNSSPLRRVVWYGCDINNMDICVGGATFSSTDTCPLNSCLLDSPSGCSALLTEGYLRSTPPNTPVIISSISDAIPSLVPKNMNEKKSRPTKFACIVYGDRSCMNKTLSNIPVKPNNSSPNSISGIASMRLTDVKKIVDTIQRNKNVPYDVLSWTCV